MKGPAARWKFDVRRVWECPACQRRERTGGQVVNLLCDCQLRGESPHRTWMRLIEEERRPAPPAETEKQSEIGLEQPPGPSEPPQ